MSTGIAIGASLSPTPPESNVTGSGAYTVPAGKYGFISMTTSCGAGASSANGSGGSGSANANHQWVVAGTSINTTASFPGSFGSAYQQSSPYARVTINGTIACNSQAVASSGIDGSGNLSRVASTGGASWSIAIFSV